MLTQAEREDREFRKSMIRKGVHLTHGSPPGAIVTMQTDAGVLVMRSGSTPLSPEEGGRQISVRPTETETQRKAREKRAWEDKFCEW